MVSNPIAQSVQHTTKILLYHDPAVSLKLGIWYEWWLLTKDDKDIGFMVLDNQKDGGAVWITILFINSLYRYNGYGTKFMHMLKKKAHKDRHTLVVDCDKESQLFYEKNGFCYWETSSVAGLHILKWAPCENIMKIMGDMHKFACKNDVSTALLCHTILELI